MNYQINLDKVIIKSCNCYQSYWKKVRKDSLVNSVVNFDHSIEKVFSYRKYCPAGKAIYHCCENCLSQIVAAIPLTIIDFTILKGQMKCIYNIRHNFISLRECCDGCINFVIANYSSSFFVQI